MGHKRKSRRAITVTTQRCLVFTLHVTLVWQPEQLRATIEANQMASPTQTGQGRPETGRPGLNEAYLAELLDRSEVTFDHCSELCDALKKQRNQTGS